LYLESSSSGSAVTGHSLLHQARGANPFLFLCRRKEKKKKKSEKRRIIKNKEERQVEERRMITTSLLLFSFIFRCGERGGNGNLADVLQALYKSQARDQWVAWLGKGVFNGSVVAVCCVYCAVIFHPIASYVRAQQIMDRKNHEEEIN
jgi:hypothetical protein